MDRYIGLDAHASSCTLAVMMPGGKRLGYLAELDRLCRPRVVRGTRYARFQPVSPDYCAL